MCAMTEVHPPPKEAVIAQHPISTSLSSNTIEENMDSDILNQKNDSSLTTDQMPAGSFQQETRELATACWGANPKRVVKYVTFLYFL